MSTPKHYQFPNGAQPLDLSRYLTSNGGQALQYIARSCRLDDKSNKHGYPADDLVKAVHLLYDELKRVGTDEDLERVRKILKAEKDKPKIPVYFEGSPSVAYEYGQPSRLRLGEAYIADEMALEVVQGMKYSGKQRSQAYLTFESK